MKNLIAIGFLCLVVSAMLLGAVGQAEAVSIKLTAITTPFPTPIGIDYYEPTNELVMSVNYSSGLPHNFRRVAADGTQSVFSSVAGLTDEVKIATVRSGNTGGFTTGDLFTGNGVDGEIAQITGVLGATVINPFVSLPGAGNGLMRGSLYVDRTGVYGGDLIAVTTAGEVWRVTSGGAPTKLADVNTHLEGVITVPNDVTTYGALAGKIIAGAEGSGKLYVFDNSGVVSSHSVGVNIEDIDLITPNENFFGVNFGTGNLLGAEASQFSSLAGGILLTQEFHSTGTSGLYLLNPLTLTSTQFTLGTGSFSPGQWEHVTFAPAGVKEIKPIPEPATMLLLGTGLVGLAGVRRKKFKK